MRPALAVAGEPAQLTLGITPEPTDHPSVQAARAWLTSSRPGDVLTERARLVVALARICPTLRAMSAACGFVWGGEVEPWEPTEESGSALLAQARAYLGISP